MMRSRNSVASGKRSDDVVELGALDGDAAGAELGFDLLNHTSGSEDQNGGNFRLTEC